MEQQRMNINSLPKIQCDEPGCECDVFEQIFVIHKLSALSPQNPDGQEKIIPAMGFRCTSCKKVLEYEY